MVGRNQVDIVCARFFQFAEDSAQPRRGNFLSAHPAGNFVILAKRAPQVAAAEKDRAASVGVANGRFFVRVQIIFGNRQAFYAASSRVFFSVRSAFHGAKGAIRHNGIIPCVPRKCNRISIDFSRRRYYNIRVNEKGKTT